MIELELAGARVAFTTRHGGVSPGPFASLNLGLLTDDDPAAVNANRALVARRLGVQLAGVKQVHGARVVVARAGGLEKADGVVSAAAGVGAIVLVADCLPVAIAGDGAVAMLHAGWRGLARGVIPAGVKALRGLGVSGPLEAAIGPGAGVCCYRTGEEVHAAFAAVPGARAGDNADLKAVARAQLEAAGVRHVRDVGRCTICDSEFFSHRRDGGVTGRQAGIAWLS